MADLILGMADELRDNVAARVGHAVRPADVHVGEAASPALCGVFTTVEDADDRYQPDPARARYMSCPTCVQRARRMP